MPAIPGRWLTILGAGVGVAYALVWSWALSSQTYNIYGAMAIIPIIVPSTRCSSLKSFAANDRLSWCSSSAFRKMVLSSATRAYVVTAGTRTPSDTTSMRPTSIRSGAGGTSSGNGVASRAPRSWRSSPRRLHVHRRLTLAALSSPPSHSGVLPCSRAFCPQRNADHKRYALLLSVPSMLYWPSSIGKESWLLFFIGVTAYGAARHFTERVGRWVVAIGGIGWPVRPYGRPDVCAIFVAQVFRPAAERERSPEEGSASSCRCAGLIHPGVGAVPGSTTSVHRPSLRRSIVQWSDPAGGSEFTLLP